MRGSTPNLIKILKLALTGTKGPSACAGLALMIWIRMRSSASTLGSAPDWFRLVPTIGFFILGTAVLESVTTGSPPSLPVARPVRESTLGFMVASRSHELEIFWNRDAPQVAGAEKATLKIYDGNVTEVVNLDRNDLHDGFVAYIPKTNDVGVRFEVSEHGATTTESARIVAVP